LQQSLLATAGAQVPAKIGATTPKPLFANPTTTVFINEFHYDNTGTDANEFVEVAAPAGTNLANYSIVLYNGNGGASYDTDALTGTATNQSGGYGFAAITYATDGIQNGAPDGIALVNTATNTLVQFLCYEGTFTATNGIANGVACTDVGVSETNSALGASLQLQGTGTTYGNFTWAATNTTNANTKGAVNTGQTFTGGSGGGQPSLSISDVTHDEGNSGTTTFTFTVSLSAPAPAPVTFDIATQDNTATVANNDYVARSLTGQTIATSGQTYTFDVTVNGDTTSEPTESFFVNVTNVTGATVTDGQGVGTITNDDVTLTPIYVIQGSAFTSPVVGTSVTTTGIVTGRKTNGFFMQDPNGDGNTSTSDAVFVFTSTAPSTVAVGDSVRVTGTVTEFKSASDTEPVNPPPGDQKTLTEINSPTITVLAAAVPTPTPLPDSIFDASATSRGAELEKYESMLVSVSSLTVSEPTNDFGEFWGVVTGVPRPFREPGIERGDPIPPADQGPFVGTAPPNVPIFDGNFERIQVDSDDAINSAGTRRTQVTLSTGAIVTNITGPLDYAFDNYRIVLDGNATPGVTPGVAAAIAAPTRTNQEFTIASANFENFGTNNPNFTARLNKASLAIRTVMHTPDILGLIEILDLTTMQQVAAKVNADANDPGVNYVAYMGTTNGTQNIGYLVNSARVTVIGTPEQYHPATTFTFGGTTSVLHDRPSYILTADVPQVGTATPLRVTVILNHTKSLIGVDSQAPFGDGTVTEGARNREKRRLQAEDIADLIQQRINENLVVMGDLNAFDFNDGLTDVVGTLKGTPAPADQVVEPSTDRWSYQLTNSMLLLPVDQRYSLLFEGNAQALDHILVNTKMFARENRFAYAHYDADFPDAFANDGTRPERLADHDAAVAFFSQVAPPSPLVISEFRFRGPTFSPQQGIDGSLDEYIELYNTSNAPLTINANDGSAGWALAYTNGTGATTSIAAVIPNNTIIPAHSHYLLANEEGGSTVAPSKLGVRRISPSGVTPASGGYTLTNYTPSNQSYRTAVGGGTIDIPDDGAIALFETANAANFSTLTRLDAVSLNTAANATGTLFREGTSLPSPGANDGQYAFVRKLASGVPQDTDNNAQDFVFVSTNAGNYGGVQSQLGAPGPEATFSPIQRNATIKASLIEPNQPSTGGQNRVRDSQAVTNGAQGTLSIRRRFTNLTGTTVTRLRFRIVDITTLNSPGYTPGGPQSDIRAIDGSNFNVTTSLGPLTVLATTVEQPFPLSQPNGGGLNSSLTVAIPGGALSQNGTIDLHFLLGVQQGGSFRFFINVEALP
jgi:predicted extracellular nuclease